jgi:hypothetical protein
MIKFIFVIAFRYKKNVTNILGMLTWNFCQSLAEYFVFITFIKFYVSDYRCAVRTTSNVLLSIFVF